MLEEAGNRKSVQMLRRLFPDYSVNELTNKYNSVADQTRDRSWVAKWATADHISDGRTENSCGQTKYSSSQSRAIVVHAVGLSHRRNTDGTRRQSHSQRQTADWYNRTHPGAKLHFTTVGVMLKTAGYKWRLRPKKSRLTAKNREQRKDLCDAWGDSPGVDWEHIVFTDSTHVFYQYQPNSHNDGVYVTDGEDVPPVTRHKHPIYEHVYGALTCHGLVGPIFVDRGLRVNSQIYRTDVLPQLVEGIKKIFTDNNDKGFTLQQDGAPAHFAAATMPVLQKLFRNDPDNGFWNKGYWPASSADLSPIESVWPLLQKHVAFSGSEPTTKVECRERVTDFFKTFPAASCKHLLSSMPNRLAECIKQNYYTTKY